MCVPVVSILSLLFLFQDVYLGHQYTVGHHQPGGLTCVIWSPHSSFWPAAWRMVSCVNTMGTLLTYVCCVLLAFTPCSPYRMAPPPTPPLTLSAICRVSSIAWERWSSGCLLSFWGPCSVTSMPGNEVS